MLYHCPMATRCPTDWCFVFPCFLIAFIATPLAAQQTVCDLFKDLHHPGNVIVRGELFLTGKVPVLVAEDCEDEFQGRVGTWPTIIQLSQEPNLSASIKESIGEAVGKAEQIKKAGKVPFVKAVISGRL